MHLRFSLLAAAILTATSSSSAVTESDPSRQLTAPASCTAYDISHQVTSGTTLLWINTGNDGSDTEWLNKANFNYNYLPGIHRFNKVIMASGDVGTVHCDAASYMNADVYLEIRSGATLDVKDANLDIGDALYLKTNAKLTQSGGTSTISVGKNLYLAAVYTISDGAKMTVGLDVYMSSNAKLTIVGDGASITASTVTPTNSHVHGLITYELGANGAGGIDLGGGELTIGFTSARISIDASNYMGGANSIPLIHGCSNIVGAYQSGNIVMTGLAAGLSGEVVGKSDGVYLELTGDGGGGSSSTSTTTEATTTTTEATTTYATTTYQTTTPATTTTTEQTTTEQTTTPATTTTTPATTTYQTTTDATTTEQTSTSQTTTPATTTTTEETTTSYTTTPETTTTTTSDQTTTTSTSTYDETTTTVAPPPPPSDDSTETIILTETGFDPITSSTTGICPPPEKTSIIIDGSAYTAGPGVISLYECSSINAGYDLMNVHLVNFPQGLWYELVYKTDSVELIIKSLANYKEYWTHVRKTYPTTEYPEQEFTDHFPEFSWDTVPTWTRFRKNANEIPDNNKKDWNFNAGPWKDDEIESIAKNNYLSWYGLNTPNHVIDTWERIKAADPNHKTMYYWNAESFWGTEGIGLEQSYLRDGTVGTGGRKLYDHSNPAMREWWLNHGLEMSQQEFSDGVFTDNTISRECDNQACNLETTDKSIMVRDLAESVNDDDLDIGNYLRQMIDGGNRFRMAYADGSYFENTHFSPGNQNDLEGILVSMQLAREASWKKKVVMWTGSRRNCGCGFNNPAFPFCTEVTQKNCIPQSCAGFVQTTNRQEPTAKLENDLEIALAEFLMIVERWSYANFNISPDASCERWRWDWSHMELLNKPLGQPLGPPLKSGHTFSRHFEHMSVKLSLKKTGYEESAHGVGGDVAFIYR